MSRRNIKLPEDEYEKHNDRRKEMGLSWAQYIDGQAPDLEDLIREIVREEIDASNRELMRELEENLRAF